MSYAIGSNSYMAFIKEVTAGVTPSTPTLKKLRIKDGGGISNERSVLRSGEIRSDRGKSDVRLGTNQPAANIPFEFAYGVFDELLSGAYGSRWKGGATITGNMTASGATITFAANDFSALGLNVGDYLVIVATTAANSGIYKIKTIGGTGNVTLTLYKADGTTDASLTTVSVAESVTIKSGYKGGSLAATGNNITVAATGKTYTAASAYWLTTLGLKVGDLIFFAGFTNAGNNGWKTVAAVTDTVLTVSQTCTNESLTSGTLETGSAVAYLPTSTTGDIPSFTIEEGFTGISQYRNIKGAKVDKFALSCQPDKMIEGSFDLVAMTYSTFAGTSIASALSGAATDPPFDSFTGTLSINNGAITESLAIVSSLNLQISNGLSRRFGLFSKNAGSIGENIVDASGSLTVFMTTGVPFSVLYDAETELNLEMRIVDLNGNAYLFTVPRIKFTKDSVSKSSGDITDTLDFDALINTAGVTMSILKQPVS